MVAAVGGEMAVALLAVALLLVAAVAGEMAEVLATVAAGAPVEAAAVEAGAVAAAEAALVAAEEGGEAAVAGVTATLAGRMLPPEDAEVALGEGTFGGAVGVGTAEAGAACGDSPLLWMKKAGTWPHLVFSPQCDV